MAEETVATWRAPLVRRNELAPDDGALPVKIVIIRDGVTLGEDQGRLFREAGSLGFIGETTSFLIPVRKASLVAKAPNEMFEAGFKVHLAGRRETLVVYGLRRTDGENLLSRPPDALGDPEVVEWPPTEKGPPEPESWAYPRTLAILATFSILVTVFQLVGVIKFAPSLFLTMGPTAGGVVLLFREPRLLSRFIGYAAFVVAIFLAAFTSIEIAYLQSLDAFSLKWDGRLGDKLLRAAPALSGWLALAVGVVGFYLLWFAWRRRRMLRQRAAFFAWKVPGP